MHTVTPLLAAGVRLTRGQRLSHTGELLATRMTARFSSAKREGWKLELRTPGIQARPELCMPLIDPRLLMSTDAGHLVIGHQIQTRDGTPVCLHQEWWIAGELPNQIRDALAVG